MERLGGMQAAGGAPDEPALAPYRAALPYDSLSIEEALRQLLPADVAPPSGYEEARPVFARRGAWKQRRPYKTAQAGPKGAISRA